MSGRLTLEGLRYVRAVHGSGSFSAAARVCGVTQPTLSNGVARLEQHLGEQLFVRSSRGVAPTPFGELVLPLVERALAAVDTIDAEARRWSPPASDSIRMGISPLINPELVARVHGAIRELPGAPAQLVLTEANLADLRDALSGGDLDVMIVPSVDPIAGYEHRVIDSEPLVLVDAAGEGVPGAVGLPDLVDKQLIVLPDTCGLTTFTRDLFRSHDLPMRLYPGEASSYRVLEEWSNLGLGAALLPRSKVADPGSVPTAVYEDGLAVEIFYEAVWDPRSPLARDLRLLTDQLARTGTGAGATPDG